MNFGQALEEIKKGHKATRKGWDCSEMFIYLTTGTIVPFENLKQETADHLFCSKTLRHDGAVEFKSHIDMKAADGSITIGWAPSQVDMLAEDWWGVEFSTQ